MRLFIRTTKTEGSTGLYTSIKIDGKAIRIPLGLDVDIKEWLKTYIGVDKNNKPIQSNTKTKNLLSKLGYLQKVHDIEAALRELRNNDELNLQSAKNVVDTIVMAEFRSQVEKQKERVAKAEERMSRDVKNYIDKFVDSLTGNDVESMTKKGEKYKERSISIFGQFHRIFNEFYSTHHIGTWDDVDKKYVSKFFVYLDSRYMRSTTVRYISCLRTIMGRAYEDGLRTKPIAGDMFYRPVVHAQDASTEIYLTAEELDALYGMKLTGLKEKIRDVFLIGCYTGQRFSDYSRINSSCMGYTAKGTKVLRLVQVKTQKKVVIPIIDEKIVSLLEKYNYNVPNIVDVVFNRYIKEICKTLSKTMPSLAEEIPTIITKKEKEAEKAGRISFKRDQQGRVLKYKWELVMSHTARRTCITLMHLSCKYTIPQMMSVSGHTKEETFFKYLKQSLDDDADSVAEAAQDGLF